MLLCEAANEPAGDPVAFSALLVEGEEEEERAGIMIEFLSDVSPETMPFPGPDSVFSANVDLDILLSSCGVDGSEKESGALVG